MKVSMIGRERNAGTVIFAKRGTYWPKVDKITVNVDAIREHYVCWRRVVISTYIHEFIHRVDWHFFNGHDMGRWKAASYERAEYWAYKIEGIVLKLLLTGIDVVLTER